VKFFERVRASYLEIAHRDSQRYRVIDASANADTVISAALFELQGLWS
jgi:thymidylate kinase